MRFSVLANFNSSRLVTSDSIGPFDRYIDVYGLKIAGLAALGGQSKVSDKFIRQIAHTAKQLLKQDAPGINRNDQEAAVKALEGKPVLQIVVSGSYSEYSPGLDANTDLDKVRDKYNNIDVIGELNSEKGSIGFGDSQATEVVEHLLHTYTHFLLPEIYPEQFNLNENKGLLYSALSEAIKNGVYDPSDYAHISNEDFQYERTLMTEYLYCLAYAEWGFTKDFVHGGSLAPEWSDRHLDSISIKRDNPLGHELYEEYFSKVISKPSAEDLLQMYRDSGEGFSLYNSDSPDYIRTDLVLADTWNDNVRINRNRIGLSSDIVVQAKQVGKSEYDSGFVGSIVTGTSGNDIIRGLAGFDQLFGKSGDDLIHGGNGRDIIDGGSGSDELHGDFGWNTYNDQQDGSKDLIAIKSDQYLSNFWYGKAGNSPNGEKADFIEGLDVIDEIKIIGVSTSDISVAENVSARGVTGIGIYAKGTLEAVYTGGNLSTSQIQNMTSGDESVSAMNNQVWSYWGDNSIPELLA